MTEYAHKGQILPIQNQMIPIEKTTTFHASYDYGLHGFNQGEIVHPIGPERGYLFNGENTRVYLPIGRGINPYTSTVEIDIDIKLNSLANQIILSSDRTGDSSARLFFGVNGGKWSIAAGSTTWSSSRSSISAAIDSWTHIKAVWEKGTASLYIDGELSDTITYTSYTIGDIGIGWNNGYTDYQAQCVLANLRIKVESETIAFYKFNEKDGGIAFDSSGNGNDGIWHGSIQSAYGPTVATLEKEKGKFKGAVLIEPETQNLMKGKSLNIAKVSQGTDGNGWYIIRDPDDTTSYHGVSAPSVPIPQGSTYTFSIEFMSDVAFTWSFDANDYSDNYTGNDASRLSTGIYNNIYNTPGEWQKVWITSTMKSDAINPKAAAKFVINHTSPAAGHKIYIRNPQLEIRDYPTSFVNGSRPSGKLWYPKELINPNEFTISCWFNIPYIHQTTTNNQGIQGNWYHPIIEIAPPVDKDNVGVSIVAGPNGGSAYLRKPHFRQAGGVSTSGYPSAPTPIQDDTWYHMTATYDGTTYRLYIDGILQHSVVAPPTELEDDFVLMVGGGYYGKPFIKIDELRIESRAISEEEVQAWAASGLHYNYLDYSMIVD